jgi:hypothetical protein
MKKKKKNLFSTTPSVLKKGIVATLCTVMMGLFLVVGCKKNDEKKPVEPPEPEYPINISFTEYSLLETSCQWTNINYDEKVIIINSDEELENHIACTGGSYPEIDFSKNSLLLARGATGGIAELTVKNLQKLSKNEYELNIEILLDGTDILQYWIVALIVEKVSEESHIELNVTEYPIAIPFTEYFIHWDDALYIWDGPSNIVGYKFPCWQNLNHDHESPDYVWGGKLSIINSNEELKNNLTCPEEYPVIDFSKQTLVLASGTTPNGPTVIRDIVFVKNSANQYTMKASIRQNICPSGGYWCIAILTPKTEDEVIVTLDIDINP